MEDLLKYLDDIQQPTSDVIDYQVDNFIEKIYEDVSYLYESNKYQDIKKEALKDLLAHELIYMSVWEDAETQAKSILANLSESQMERLIAILKFEMAIKGVPAIDCRYSKTPFIMNSLIEVLKEDQPKRGKRYCPACGMIIPANSTKCEYCYSYLTTFKDTSKIKKILQKITSKLFKEDKNEE